MKVLVLALLLFGAIPATAQPVAADPSESLKTTVKTFRNGKHYSVKYDKFRDITTVSIKFRLGASPDSVTYLTQLNASGTATHWLIWKAYSSKWRYLDNRDLLGLVDGNRMRLGTGKHDGEVVGADRYSVRVREELTFKLDADQARALGEGKSVELLIGRTAFTLKDEHKEALRDLLSLDRHS